MNLKPGDKIGIVACSNAQPVANRTQVNKLLETLKELGLEPMLSPYIYETTRYLSGPAQKKAKGLMAFYEDPDIKGIFDISGGDLANEVLAYLDYESIAKNPKPLFGYSDVSAVINAIYEKTGHSGVLYQVRNLIYDCRAQQLNRFKSSLFRNEKALFDFKYDFVQGSRMEGIVVGGNIRCFLKLAGTPYLPDFQNKLLLLESYSGGVDKMIALLNQYQQMGVFDQISGILLGTFTKMEEAKEKPKIEELVLDILNNPKMPLAKTQEIGHGPDSKAIVIGEMLVLK